MNIKLKFKRLIQLEPEAFEKKVNIYLKKNHYKVIERGTGFIVFVNDESSNRKRHRSDFHTRIGEGKFEFYTIGEETMVKLEYLTSIIFPVIFIMMCITASVSYRAFSPIVLSIVCLLPILFKMAYLNENVISEIMEC